MNEGKVVRVGDRVSVYDYAKDLKGAHGTVTEIPWVAILIVKLDKPTSMAEYTTVHINQVRKLKPKRPLEFYVKFSGGSKQWVEDKYPTDESILVRQVKRKI